MSPVSPVQPEIIKNLIKRTKNLRSQPAPIPSTPKATAPWKWFKWLLPCIGHHDHEQGVDPPSEAQGKGARENALMDAVHPTYPEAPPLSPVLSTHHDSSFSGWGLVISGLIDTIFSDRDEVKGIGQLSGGDAQIFIDMVYEVYLYSLSSPKVTPTNIRWVSNQASEFLDPALWTRCLQVLSKICGRHALLPRSLSIPISWDPAEEPLYRAGCADVWKGISCGQNVAIKIPRLYRSVGHERVKKVSSGSSPICSMY